MDADWGFIAHSFASLIAILDPIGALPFFLALLPRDQRGAGARLALLSSVAVFVTLIIFSLFGRQFLDFFGISISAFRIAGGLLIFMMALTMLQGSVSTVKHGPDDSWEEEEMSSGAIVPIAIPLLAGPGTLSTTILLSERAGSWENSLALMGVITVCCVLVYLFLLLAEPIKQRLGRIGIRVVTRVMGLIVASIAIQFMIDGLSDVFPGLVALPAAMAG